jgi:NADP-dependent 3-hydroxy acid dehydrogenase YdfG
MSKTIVVAGFGTGISKAVAEKFGQEGFSVALVARNAERLSAATKELEAKGIRAAAFATDLSDPQAVHALPARVREQLGPATVLHWNAYAMGAGDLLKTDAAELRQLFDLPVTSLVQAVRAFLPDLQKQPEPAVLITNGSLGVLDPAVDAMAVSWSAMGLAVANAAKHKLVRLLSAKLQPEGVYVGEVTVAGTVKGTPWDNGSATLESSTIAARFFDLYRSRSALSVTVS